MPKVQATVKIKLNRTAIRRLRRLPKDIQRDAARSILAGAARFIRIAAIVEAPRGVRTGIKAGKTRLYQTIDQAVRSYKHVIMVVIGPTYPEGSQAHLVEHGHVQMPTEKQAASENVADHKFGFRTTPNPFMQRAYDNTKRLAWNSIQAGAKKVVREHFRRLRGK